ncbi:serine hydrolase domain-containing protein [Arcanobacterium hippocoleae]
MFFSVSYKTNRSLCSACGVERGDFPLEAPAGPQGATLAHLLSHASGLPSMPGEPIAQPGKRRIYSNYGFDVLSSWVQEHTGKPISAYIQQNVLNPLGMDTTVIPGSIAYSGRSTLDSLIRFAAELLQPTLVSSELFTKATEIAFNNIPGVLPGYGRQENNAWGLGFEIRAQKSPHWLAPDFSAHSFGHFGQSGSFIWVDPQVRKAGVFLSNRNFGQDHIMRWGDLTAQMRALN